MIHFCNEPRNNHLIGKREIIPLKYFENTLNMNKVCHHERKQNVQKENTKTGKTALELITAPFNL